jgi:hypothetical protein
VENQKQKESSKKEIPKKEDLTAKNDGAISKNKVQDDSKINKKDKNDLITKKDDTVTKKEDPKKKSVIPEKTQEYEKKSSVRELVIIEGFNSLDESQLSN